MHKVRRKKTQPSKGRRQLLFATLIEDGKFAFARWGNATWMVAYLAALIWWRDHAPDGLNNDAVEEALRGLYLVEPPKFEVITLALGHSAETLYLYIVGWLAKTIGPSSLAIQLPSWAFAIGVIWLLSLAARGLNPAIPKWVPVLLGMSSVWLFHYARSGLRAISAPFFFLLFWIFLDATERSDGGKGPALAAGAVLGLSVYAYTSCRALPVIFIVYATLRLLQHCRDPKGLSLRYSMIICAALVVSIPNLVFLFRFPEEFLFRGSYSVPRDPSLWGAGLGWSFAFLFYYPSHLTSEFFQPEFIVDSVSNGLAVTGLQPIHGIVALAVVVGVIQACRTWRKVGSLFLLVSWLVGTFVIGVGGPSLTRLLVLLPVYLLLATLGIGVAVSRFPTCRRLVALLLVVVLIEHGYRYFKEMSGSPLARFYASSAATPIGKRAALLGSEGERVLCVVAKDANVVRYFAHNHAQNVRVVEFYFRPLAVEEIPLAEFQPAVLFVENVREFSPLVALFPGSRRSVKENFVEVSLEQPQR